jgi:hypothetical protein
MRAQDYAAHFLVTAGGSGLIGYGLKVLLERQRQAHERKLEAQRQDYQLKLEAQRYQAAHQLLHSANVENVLINGSIAAEVGSQLSSTPVDAESSAQIIPFRSPRSEDDDP